jgi:hypothetical protein
MVGMCVELKSSNKIVFMGIKITIEVVIEYFIFIIMLPDLKPHQ